MSDTSLLPAPFPALFQALERSSDPVFITDRSNNIVSWNDAAVRLLGFTGEEVIGRPCAGITQGCDAAGNRYCTDHCPIREMGERGEVIRQFNLTLKGKGNAQVVVDIAILHFAAPSPYHFFLAHILKPARSTAQADSSRSVAVEALPKNAHQTARESDDARARRLTQREVEILGLLSAGRSTAQIGDGLHISTVTARNHIQNILEKLEVHSKAEAVAFAFQKCLF